MSKQYVKTVEDEIDWKRIDQLHGATSTFSATSLEIKKLFIVLVGIAIPSLIKLAHDKLDLSLFVSIYFLALVFWLLDGFTYFYQEALREKMKILFIQIENRNKETTLYSGSEGVKPVENDITLESNRTKDTRLKRSLFNSSQLLYLLIFILTTIGLILFKFNVIS